DNASYRMVDCQCSLDDVKMRARDVVTDQAETIGVGGSDDVAGEREVKPDLVVEAGEKIGAADIWKEPDTDLRHGHLVPLAGDAMRAVERDADTAAEEKAVDEGHVWPDELLQRPDMGIGGAVKLADRVEGGRLDPRVQGLDVAAAREHGRVRRLHDHAIDVRVRRPELILRAQRVEHFTRESVKP